MRAKFYLGISREAQLFAGWVSGRVTLAGVGFHTSTQSRFILYLIPPTYLGSSGSSVVRERRQEIGKS